MTIYVLLYMIIALLLLHYKRGQLLKDIVTYAIRFNNTTKRLANDLDIPILIADYAGNCLWRNKNFDKQFCNEETSGKFVVDSVIPNLTLDTYPKTYEQNSEIHFHNEDIFYKAVIQKVNVDKVTGENGENPETMGLGDNFYVFFIYDETEIVHYIKENNEQRLDVGLLYIDNYDESLEQVDEVRRALLSALIDRKINKYMMKIDAITKKLEKDKYIFLFKHKYLSYLQNDKFSLLDDIRTINSREESSITISMGIGTQGDTYKKRQEYSRTAIDLALARGGDQVVVKTKDNLLYYGGKSRQQEKNTRVKARVKAHALRESIEVAEQVIIMGHRLPDEDALGSAVGIYRIADSLGKRAHIVVNKVSASLRPVVNMLLENGNYPGDFIISGETAKEIFTEGTLLVIVDVNHASYTDEPALVTMASSLVVLDHHRQSGESFPNPTLSYIESYASSACEMVAEVLQYIGDDGIKIKPAEADAMYAGIVIDTNNFMNQAGVRTFEAAAFLRRNGADVVRVRKLFRDRLEDYRARAEAIQKAEIYHGAFAISVCPSEGLESPTVVGAQAANELLDIVGIKASFILTQMGDTIYFSARSIDEINVQIIMERLGGGGHRTIAGAQLKGATIDEAREKLKDLITDMMEKGEI